MNIQICCTEPECKWKKELLAQINTRSKTQVDIKLMHFNASDDLSVVSTNKALQLFAQILKTKLNEGQ